MGALPPEKILLKFAGSSVIAVLHVSSLINSSISKISLKSNINTLTIIVKLHNPSSLLAYPFQTTAQYIIQITSIKSENAIKYQSLNFCDF